jgi:hypothetical protein
MNEQEIKINRLNELKLKIVCTEATLDTYKDNHPFLYQTNFYYLERLNQELQDIENSYREMRNGNQRKFSRIAMQRAVHLNFSTKRYHGVLDNISLSGLFVKGSFKQSKGDLCKIYIKDSNGYSDYAIRALGLVARESVDGVGIEFIAMKKERYEFLKKALLNHATNPLVLKDEITRRNFFCFTDDIACNRIFLSKKNKIKKLLDLFNRN